MQLPIHPGDNDRLKTSKVWAMLRDLGVFPANAHERPDFRKGHRRAARLIDRAIANVQPVLARCANIQFLATAANAKFAAAYVALASGSFVDIASANAADGHYTLNGQSVPITAIINTSGPDNLFDPATDLDAGGIFCPGNVTRIFDIADPLRAELIANGFTVTLDFMFTDAITVSAAAHTASYGNQPEVDAVYDAIAPAIRTTVSDFSGNHSLNDTTNVPVPGRTNRLAATLAGDRTSCSINGGPVSTVPYSGIDPTLAEVFFSFSSAEADGRLREFAFYAPVDDADLPRLSAL